MLTFCIVIVSWNNKKTGKYSYNNIEVGCHYYASSRHLFLVLFGKIYSVTFKTLIYILKPYCFCIVLYCRTKTYYCIVTCFKNTNYVTHFRRDLCSTQSLSKWQILKPGTDLVCTLQQTFVLRCIIRSETINLLILIISTILQTYSAGVTLSIHWLEVDKMLRTGLKLIGRRLASEKSEPQSWEPLSWKN